ncbi:MAG: ABC transporter permease [Alphaproteobacteria bacterium]|nr:ABC transporter permease [Alphaproteobacteria bacterium]
MKDYVLRRIAVLPPTLFFASLLVFFSIRLIPGDVIDLMLAQNDVASSADRESLRAALGLDRPIWEQYFIWAGKALTGDLGSSLWQNAPVSSLLLQRLPVTLELGFLALIVSVTVGIAIGVFSAVRQDTAADYVLRSFSLLMLSIPGFWLGTLVMVFPSVWWRWSPELEFSPFFADPLRNLGHILPPAILLGLALSAVTMRMTRTMMLEVMRQDYIRTARAKGLKEGAVVFRHALRNSLIPVVTVIGLQAPLMFGGAVILEQIFALPGMGSLLLEAVFQRDYPIVSGVFLVVGVSVLVINLIVDLAYGYLDPRVRRS